MDAANTQEGAGSPSLGSAELHRLHVPVVHLRRQHAGLLQQLELFGAVVEAEVVTDDG